MKEKSSYLFDFCQLNLHHPFGESVGAESLLERAEVEGRVAMDETLQPGLALSNGDVRGSLNAVLAVEVAFRAESIIVKKIWTFHLVYERTREYN